MTPWLHRQESCARRAIVLLALVLAGCAPKSLVPSDPSPVAPPSAPAPPSPEARKPEPQAARIQRGRLSLYGREFAGRKTASGETFDPEAMTMAHRTLPFGTRVRVTNLENGRTVEVVVNDRGPFVEGRIADLSLAAARVLGMLTDGVVEGVLEILPTVRN